MWNFGDNETEKDGQNFTGLPPGGESDYRNVK